MNSIAFNGKWEDHKTGAEYKSPALLFRYNVPEIISQKPGDRVSLQSSSLSSEGEIIPAPTVSAEDKVKPEASYSFVPLPGLPPVIAMPVTIGIIHINDEHDNTFRKFPRESTLVHQREQHYGDSHSFIINLGDVTYNGNTREKGPHFFGPAADIMNAQHVEFYIPGNHDHDHGIPFLKGQLLNKLKARMIAANMHMKNGAPVENSVPYTIEEIDGIKVGLLCFTTPKQKEGKDDPEGAVIDPILDSAMKYVPEVKGKGADVIVLAMHEGVNTAEAIAETVPGIDIIIAAHDHRKCAKTVRNPDGRDTIIVDAGGNTNYVGDLTIEVDPASKKVIRINYKLFSTSGVAPDRETSDIIARYRGKD